MPRVEIRDRIKELRRVRVGDLLPAENNWRLPQGATARIIGVCQTHNSTDQAHVAQFPCLLPLDYGQRWPLEIPMSAGRGGVRRTGWAMGGFVSAVSQQAREKWRGLTVYLGSCLAVLSRQDSTCFIIATIHHAVTQRICSLAPMPIMTGIATLRAGMSHLLILQGRITLGQNSPGQSLNRFTFGWIQAKASLLLLAPSASITLPLVGSCGASDG